MTYPSVHTLEALQGNEPIGLMKKTQCPIMFMLAADCAPEYSPGGELYEKSRESFKQTDHMQFTEMGHGWAIRGDASNETVKRDIEVAVNNMVYYLRKFLK